MAIDIGTAVAYLNLDSTNFNSGISAAESALQQFQRQGGGVAEAFGVIGQTMSNVGYDLTKKVTVPLAEFGQTAIQNFRDYESAFAGVKKTINEADLSKFNVTYEQLSEIVEGLSTHTASTAEEIASVMEMAGQLGIELGEGGKDIAKFTETMIMLGDSTNLTADEAALSLAKFMNITNMSAEESDRLGSAIVDLGNNFATQEDQIVNMSTRLASAGTIAGLTEQEILALATSMSSAGIRAEAGGSAMATTLTQIEKIVQGVTENSEEQLKELGRVSGMTAEEFSNAWKKDPITALTAFLHGLGDLDEQGESAVVTLDTLGMTGVRQANMLKALALSADNMDYALEVANGAWQENTALTEEASKRYETLDSKISQLNERWKIVKRDIAEMLIPILEKLMDVVSKVIDKWNSFTDEQKQTALRIAEIAAAVGPVLVVFGKLFTTIQQVSHIFSVLSSVFSGISAGPIAAIVAGIALLVTGFIKAYNESESFRNTVARLWDEVSRILSMLFELFKGIWEAVKPVLDVVIQIISELLQILLPPLVNLIHAILDAIQPLIPLITSLLKLISSIATMLLSVLRPVIEGIATVIAFVANLIAIAIDEIASGIAFVVSGFKILFDAISSMVDFVTSCLKQVGDFIFDKLKSIVDFFDEVVHTIFGFFEWLWDVLFGHSIIPDICNAFTKWFSETFEKVLGFIKDFIHNAVEKFNELKDKVLEKVNEMKDKIQQRFQEMKEDIVNKFQEIKENVQQKLQELRDNVVSKVQELKEKFVNNVKDMKDDVVNKFSELKENITSKINEITENSKRKFNELKTEVSNAMQTLKDIIADIVEKVKSKFHEMQETVSNIIVNFKSIGENLINNLWEGLKSAWSNVASWFESKLSWVSDIISSIRSGISSITSGFGDFFDGSHASGLDYVPFDGYVAQLHEGERVLTKQENKEYNDSNGTSSGGDTYNFYNTKPDPYEYARQMKRVKKELSYT